MILEILNLEPSQLGRSRAGNGCHLDEQAEGFARLISAGDEVAKIVSLRR